MKPSVRAALWLIAGLFVFALAAGNAEEGVSPTPDTGWPAYGGDAGGMRYSPAEQITVKNVKKLKRAWTYRTGHAQKPESAFRRSAFEGTPILAQGKLVLCTPFNEVIALDPGTGEEQWRYDPKIDLDQRPANQFVCRGVSQWQDEAAESDSVCSARLFMGTNDSRLIALDAATGKPCPGFGDDGIVRIDPGMDLIWPGEFQITSPPAVIGDTVIVGSAISDNARVTAPLGTVRAFDARDGALRWTFDAYPPEPSAPVANGLHEGAPAPGHANVWAPISVDTERGLVFLPTSSPSPDFYGGLRPGDNRYANSVVALKAETGEVVWYFQTVHHDIWDYDLPAQPGLYTITRGDRRLDVVAQVTKTGMVFVLDRDTGEPVHAVEERPVPQDAVEGEWLSPTQPFPVKPPLLVPSEIKPGDAWGLMPWDRGACREKIAAARSEGLFTPPSRQGTIFYPFTGGGANWGGAAFDPARNLLVVNTSRMIHLITLFEAGTYDTVRETYHDTEVSPQRGAPFGMKRDVLVSGLGLPCNPPPWGMLHGVDLDTGEIVWESVLGTTEDLNPLGLAFPWGTPNLGGPMVTAGGVVFIGAAMDNYLRAFAAEDGKELTRWRLPAGGQATPMTYVWQGRQYVVIAAGGHARAGTKLGDWVIAFALPSKKKRGWFE